MATLAAPSPAERILEEDLDAILAADLPWGALDGASVLVSGGGGFLPSYMVEALLALRARRGAGPEQVVALVRSPGRAERRFARHLGRRDFRIIAGDVAEKAPEGRFSHVIHAASPATPRRYLADPWSVVRANLDGTRNMLEAAHAGRGRFLLFSSGEVYGETPSVPTREDQYGLVEPMAVRSCYAEGKRMAETMTVCFGHQFGLSTSVVRPFHTYGPGVALDDGRVFADFVADVLAGRDIVMKSDGSARRAFCYVADATAGFFTVLLKGADGTAYNVGNPDGELSIRDLAALLVGLRPELGLSVRIDLAPRGNDYAPSPISRNAPDIGRIARLGWRPRTSPAEGFARMIASYA